MGLDRSVVEHLVRLLGPLRFLGDSDEFANILDLINWDASLLGISAADLASDAASLATALDSASRVAGQDDIDLTTIAETIASLGLACANFVQALASLPTGSGVPANALAELGTDLLGFLLESHAAGNFPRLVLAGKLLGFVKQVPVPQLVNTNGSVLRPQTSRLELDLPALTAALRDPLGYARTAFLLDSAGTRRVATAIADTAGPIAADGLVSAGITAGYGITPVEPGLSLTAAQQSAAAHMMLIDFLEGTAGAGIAGIFRLALGLTDDTSQQGLGLLLAASGDVSISTGLANGTLKLAVSGAQKPLVITGQSVQGAGGAVGSITFGAQVDYSSASTPAMTFGSANGTRLQIASLQAKLAANVGNGTVDVTGSVNLTGMVLAIRGGDGDGFLSSVLPQDPVSLHGDLGVDLSLRTGVRVHGAGTLEWRAAVHKSIGPIELIDIAADVVLSGNTLQVEFTAMLGIALGPVSATIDGIGIAAKLQQAAAAGSGPPSGNAGPYSLTVGFQPPDGIALALDAAPVSGVGFIAFDETDARYLGALALAVGDVSISAVGVLDTRLPGGAQGYSLVVVASATFPPVQLGFGFSLDGLGGLIGVNRTADVPTLQATARAGQLDDLMFPADLIHRAPQVAANLAQEFPAAQGHYIIGPAVRLAWGSDGLVDAEVGVFIELSIGGGGLSLLRVALLGSVHLTLPEAVDPIADLTLDVLGIVDLAAKTLSLDAGLRNSKIAGFPLTGQAALRAGWGADPAFVFAIGGLNPHFPPPAGFPVLQRVTLCIADGDAQLTLSAYLALTSNTLQLGCAASLNAAAGSASVAASLSFDALVQFKPFGLIIDLTVAACVMLNGNAILTLNLDLHLTGPSPWQVTGSASFHFLICNFSVPIHITVGPQPAPAAPTPVDLDGNLTTALSDARSWQTGPPAGQGVVKVREQDKAHPAVHPLGSLTVRQHAVPLGHRIERYGPDLLQAACRYDITAATLAGQTAQPAGVTDFFAPAQFLTMSDADKLSAPSFEQMTAGVTLGSTALTVPGAPGLQQGTTMVVDTPSNAQWDMLILDSPDPVTTTTSGLASVTAPVTATVLSSSQQVTLPGSLLAAQLSGGSAAVNGPGGRGSAFYTRPGLGNGVAVQQPSYAVVKMNLVPVGRDDQERGRHLDIPTASGAPTTVTAGVSGLDWQVVYNSEVAGG